LVKLTIELIDAYKLHKKTTKINMRKNDML